MTKKEKVTEYIPIEKTYHSLVLGLDISTSCIGISIVYDDGIHEPQIVEITHVAPKVGKHINKKGEKYEPKGIEALIIRKEIFENEFLKHIYESKEMAKFKEQGLEITECVIEAPLVFATGNSNAETVAQLLRFNTLLSESVYRVLGIIPYYISSYDARMKSFPELLSIRKFNKKGDIYPISHFKKCIKDNNLTLFGSFPFDCNKKNIMMNLVSEKYPNIQWIYNQKEELKKENYDACDSLVCVLAYINEKKFGELKYEIVDSEINEKDKTISYSYEVWDQKITKKLTLP